MFEWIWRLLWGEDTTTTRNIVLLEDIPTWRNLYGENNEDFANTLSGIEESPRYAEDPEINSKVSIYGADDMTSLKVDGVVRSTDVNLTSQEGISGAIRRAAGSKLDAEIMALRGCKPGEAKTTSGCNLPARYIVHTVGTKTEKPEILERCYKSCLEQMRLNKMRSLAICCISTGLNGYPIDKAVLVALNTVRVWLEELKSNNKLDEIDRIVFCFYSDADNLLYRIWMQIFFPTTYVPEPTPIVLYTRTLSTEGEAAYSVNSFDPLEGSIEEERREQKTLRPLPGFIELTTEPDMITLDDDPNTMRAKMPCGHVIGSESMTDYFRDVLETGKSKFVCSNCDAEWQYFLVRHVACLSINEMRQFEKKLEKNFLQRQKGNQECPGCRTWCMRADGAGNRVRCPICTDNRGKKFDFCWVCSNEWKRFLSSGHCGNHGCNGRDRRIEFLANCPTKKIDYCDACPSVRGCPKCGILVEHKDKCGHVNCSTCHLGFCFICLKEKKDGVDWPCRPYLNTCQLAPRQTVLPGSQ